MIRYLKRRLNIRYAQYLKGRLRDKYADEDTVTLAEKHSAKISFLKKIFLGSLILMVLVIIGWPYIQKNWQGYEINLARDNNNKDDIKIDGELEEKPVMIKPKLYGYDSNNRPYRITADKGISVSKKKVVLVNIKGDMELNDASKLNLKSDQGDYYLEEKEISLNGGVELQTENGYEFETTSAYIKLKENTATGSNKVTITGKIGKMESNGFIIKNSGEEIFLFGGVKIIGYTDEEFK